MNKLQLIQEYSQYKYIASLSYGEGKGFIDSNNPWFMIYISYKGDAVITPNLNDIPMIIRMRPDKMFFKQLSFNNTKVHLFNYFGSLEIKSAMIYGLGGAKGSLWIQTPNFDQPELIGTNPEDFTRFPEKVKDGFTYNTKETLKILSKIKKDKKGQATKRGSMSRRTATSQSRISSGGGTY